MTFKEALKKTKLAASELHLELNRDKFTCSLASVYNWYNGNAKPPFMVIKKVCELANIPMEKIEIE